MGGSEFEIGKNQSKRGGRSFSLKIFGARGGVGESKPIFEGIELKICSK